MKSFIAILESDDTAAPRPPARRLPDLGPLAAAALPAVDKIAKENAPGDLHDLAKRTAERIRAKLKQAAPSSPPAEKQERRRRAGIEGGFTCKRWGKNRTCRLSCGAARTASTASFKNRGFWVARPEVLRRAWPTCKHANNCGIYQAVLVLEICVMRIIKSKGSRPITTQMRSGPKEKGHSFRDLEAFGIWADRSNLRDPVKFTEQLQARMERGNDAR